MPALYRSFVSLVLLVLCWVALPALAISESDLLPVEEAFGVDAAAPSQDRIEVRWRVADGYYLYRHRIGIHVESANFEDAQVRLPDGVPQHDEFFGDVEIYRGVLTAVLTGVPKADARAVDLRVKYQGCADAGICYPPQTQTLRVALPPSDVSAAALPVIALPGAAAVSPVAVPARGIPQSVLGNISALPEDRAFGFEAVAEDGNAIRLRFTAAAGYYLYRDRIQLKVDGHDGVRGGIPRWPSGTSYRDEYAGDVEVYFDHVDVVLPLRRTSTDAAEITVTATFQGCQENGICYPPMTRQVSVSLPSGRISEDTAGSMAVAELAEILSGNPSIEVDDASRTTSTVDGPDASAGNALRSKAPAASSVSLWKVLFSALLGGMLLNLMPCVLPILSLKTLGLLKSGESRQRARAHALWYTSGVLASFAAIGGGVLALRALEQKAAWGMQLQYPWFVAVLAYLVFAMGLSLSGVVTLGTGAGGIGQRLSSRSGPVGDFFTGVLACVVASPCIGPFMGAALAFAFIAPTLQAFSVFLMLGLGLALPFLLMGFIPALVKLLPKPGAWMETLKQVFAFPMYLTAVWLLWILGTQRGVNALASVLAGAVLLALGLWWYERSRWRDATLGRILAALMIGVALLPIWSVAREDTASAEVLEVLAYSPQRLERLQADRRVIFVNMTADWCVTCKANEFGVLSRDAFRAAMRRADAVYLKGDWTEGDPQIGEYLRAHNAVGVPLYVVYGPGALPQILPPILTETIVEDALVRAMGRE
ncbi:MAG: thioredoxin family protein [Xanthomonadaceae bacterium]|jgi:thiol:disulfide interchange protein DsbD|nr:thioredoxin family protein [Xanthomonadaceae bacterium]